MLFKKANIFRGLSILNYVSSMTEIDTTQVASIDIKTTYPPRSTKRAQGIVEEALEDGEIAQIDVFSEEMEKRAYVLVETDIDHIEAELTFEEEKTQTTTESFTQASEVLSL